MLSGMLFKSEANCIRNSDHWDKPGNQVYTYWPADDQTRKGSMVK